jgi:hypothetical protein
MLGSIAKGGDQVIRFVREEHTDPDFVEFVVEIPDQGRWNGSLSFKLHPKKGKANSISQPLSQDLIPVPSVPTSANALSNSISLGILPSFLSRVFTAHFCCCTSVNACPSWHDTARFCQARKPSLSQQPSDRRFGASGLHA